MNLVIEVGNQKQKRQIKEEMNLFVEVANFFDPPLNISHVILASNFQDTVNKLHGTTDYRATRGGGAFETTAAAKIVELKNGNIAIVLSPSLYTENQDRLTRYFTFIHELTHVANKRRFPELPRDSYTLFLYLANMYTLFDEYLADRVAFHVVEDIFPAKSVFWNKFIQEQKVGFSDLIKDMIYYQHIRSEIKQFRVHSDVMKFLKKIQPSFDAVAISTVHLFSVFDQYPDLDYKKTLSNSNFVTPKTFMLMEFFKDKYINSEYDLQDGLELIKEYMTIFGIRFEDTEEGGYFHVLDI